MLVVFFRTFGRRRPPTGVKTNLVLIHPLNSLTRNPFLNGYSLIKSPIVAEPPKLFGPHAPIIVSKTLDGYACAPDNLTGSV
jgi:hypothetical protein